MGQGLIDWCKVLSFQYSFATVPFICAGEESQGVLRLSYFCTAPITLLLPGFSGWCCMVSNITATFKKLSNIFTKNTGLNWQPLRNFLTKFWISCFALFLKAHANLWSWSHHLGMYPPPGNSHQERTLQYRNLERHLQPRLRNRSVIRTLDWDVEDLFFLCPSFALALGYCKRKEIFLNLLQGLSPLNE